VKEEEAKEAARQKPAENEDIDRARAVLSMLYLFRERGNGSTHDRRYVDASRQTQQGIREDL
jgi:hypothetical protein